MNENGENTQKSEKKAKKEDVSPLVKPTRNRAKIALFGSIALLVMCAMFIAISVTGKRFAINLTPMLRISFENTPIIMAGYFFGPIIGLCVGLAADLLGCVVMNYDINPIILVASGLVGFIAGLPLWFWKDGYRKGSEKYRFDIRLVISIFFAYLIGSVIVKSFALAIYSGTMGKDEIIKIIMFRGLIYLSQGVIEYIFINSLLQNSTIRKYIKFFATPLK